MLLDELVRPGGISGMEFDIICHKEGEQERFAVSYHFYSGQTSDQDALSGGNAKCNGLYLPVRKERRYWVSKPSIIRSSSHANND
jgi:hypothetical protein